MKYRNYLHSKKWRNKKRDLAIEYGGKFCAVCLTKKNIDTHHLTYNRLGKERMSDLLFLCHDHHFQYHQMAKDIKAKGWDDINFILNNLKATSSANP